MLKSAELGRALTEFAPFKPVEAEDKRYARTKILETVCSRLEREL